MFYTHAAVALVAFAAGAAGAWHVQAWRHDSAELERVERAAKDTFRNVERQDTAVGDYTKDQANAKVIYQRIVVEVDKIVERPSYRAQCIDADGMRQLSAAIDGTDTQPSPVQPVPPSTPAR